MRLSRTDLIPVLAIIAGGALGLATSASLVLSSRSDHVPVADQSVIVPDGQRISYWSSDGRIEYQPICPRTPGFSPPYPCSGDVSAPVLGVAPPVTVGYAPRYVSTGHLLFVTDGALMAVRFDPTSAEPTGSAVPVAETLAKAYAVSESGTLIYSAGGVAEAEGSSDLWFNNWRFTRDGSRDVWVVNADGGTPIRLINTLRLTVNTLPKEGR